MFIRKKGVPYDPEVVATEEMAHRRGFEGTPSVQLPALPRAAGQPVTVAHASEFSRTRYLLCRASLLHRRLDLGYIADKASEFWQ